MQFINKKLIMIFYYSVLYIYEVIHRSNIEFDLVLFLEYNFLTMISIQKGSVFMDNTYKVVSPLAPPASRNRNVNPSLPDLNGKVIGELWDYSFRGDETFPIIERCLKERYPDVKFVGYDYFGNFHDPAKEAEMMASLPAKLKASGVDAVIVGNGC